MCVFIYLYTHARTHIAWNVTRLFSAHITRSRCGVEAVTLRREGPACVQHLRAASAPRRARGLSSARRRVFTTCNERCNARRSHCLRHGACLTLLRADVPPSGCVASSRLFVFPLFACWASAVDGVRVYLWSYIYFGLLLINALWIILIRPKRQRKKHAVRSIMALQEPVNHPGWQGHANEQRAYAPVALSCYSAFIFHSLLNKTGM